MTSSAILDLINMYSDSSKNFGVNLTSGSYGTTFVGVTSKSTNHAKMNGYVPILVKFNA